MYIYIYIYIYTGNINIYIYIYIYIHSSFFISSDTVYSLETQPRAMDSRDGWRESVMEISTVSATCQ